MIFSGPLLAQSFREERIEVSPFGGGTFYRGVSSGAGSHLTTGPVFGGRVTENLWSHFGLEQSIGYNMNQFEFKNPVPGVVVMQQPLDTRVTNANFDFLYYFTRLGSRARPFLAGGAGGARFNPTSDAKDFFRLNSIKPTGQLLRQETRAQYNYGAGVKVRFTDLFGLRFDVRGMLSRNPTFGMSTIPNGEAYIPNGDWLSAIEATAGLVFNFGPGASTAHMITVPAIAAEPPSAILGFAGVSPNNLVGLNATNSVCAGSPVRLTSTATDSLGHPVAYHWLVNGQPTAGDTGTFTYTPASPGLYRVELQVSDTARKPAPPSYAPAAAVIYARDCRMHQMTLGPITAVPPEALMGGVPPGTPIQLSELATDPLGHTVIYHWLIDGQPAGGNTSTIAYTPTQPGQHRVELQVTDTDANPAPPASPMGVLVTVRDNSAPTARNCQVNPARIIKDEGAQTAALSLEAAVAQGNMPRVRWTVTEGAVTNPNSAQTTFDASNVSFPPGAQSQTKTITATATVTDDSGATASCNTAIVVSTNPKPFHYGDIVFGQGSARVNNCAKRILIERVYPQLTGAYQGYTLVLVGHIDPSEPSTRQLDRQRVLNSAAVISAGKDTCPALEPARIRGDWAGTAVTESKPTSCSVIFDAAPAERRADRVNANDARAKNRRVEIWLVPPGQALPASVKEMRTLPTPELRRLACPR